MDSTDGVRYSNDFFVVFIKDKRSVHRHSALALNDKAGRDSLSLKSTPSTEKWFRVKVKSDTVQTFNIST